jgi:hypothetical protein
MFGTVWLLIVIAVWVALQAWILPRLGVST